MKQISIKGILDDLTNGLTRTVDGKGYNSELGSIEQKYELSKSDVKEIFKHPLLANKKTKLPRSFVLVDDVTASKTITLDDITLDDEEFFESKAAYGAKPQNSTSTIPQPTEQQQDSNTVTVNL